MPSAPTLASPYLLFLGDAPDDLAIKTARGVAHWRPELCVGELAYDDCRATSLGLPRLDLGEARARGAATLVVGVANRGGVISTRWIATLRDALELGFDLASGLHARLADVPELREAAERHGRTLHDVRQPPPGLPIGTGERRPGKRLLTVGTDCSVGKMYTSLALEREMHARGLPATFRATGQTGIFIAGTGISVDAVVSDFLSGAVEVLAPANAPDHWDLIEGQGSLFHASFAGVSLGLLHGAQADALVLCHDPVREHLRGLPHARVPAIDECIVANEAAARLTNPAARVIGIAANTSSFATDAEAADCLARLTEAANGLPATDPVRFGPSRLVDALVDTCSS